MGEDRLATSPRRSIEGVLLPPSAPPWYPRGDHPSADDGWSPTRRRRAADDGDDRPDPRRRTLDPTGARHQGLPDGRGRGPRPARPDPGDRRGGVAGDRRPERVGQDDPAEFDRRPGPAQ